MNRRKLLQILGFIPPALLVASCEIKLTSTPTIVKGKIIDENGLPLEGAGLRLSGFHLKGFSGSNTFSIYIECNNEGIYMLSQLVPKDTDAISILPYSTNKVPIGNQGYAHYIFLDGHYTQLGGPYDIPRSAWGKNITLNYQFVKQ